VSSAAATPAASVPHGQRIAALRPDGAATACVLADGTTLLVSNHLAGLLQPGDGVEFSPCSTGSVTTELRVVRSGRGRPKEFYLAAIGYVTHPKQDKRQESYLRAEVTGSALGIRSIHLATTAVRDYFYRADRTRDWPDSPTLYEVLHVDRTASLGDLRLAHKVRRLELDAGQSSRPAALREIDRAFNLLMQPDIRSCYDALLSDPEAPALFPYSGFGALLTAGERSRDRATFFAQRILSFLPERRQRRFLASLRRIEFLHDHVAYRDSRRKVEVLLDPIVLPLAPDPTWNQWRHLLGAKIGIEATFVTSGKYRFRSGEWQLTSWSTALPSSLRVTLPADIQDQVQAARTAHQRFGQYFTALEPIRARLEREALERRELDRLCGELGIPGDFDVAQISWKPDYDSFFYTQLRKRAAKMYLYRDEYIFDIERAIVVEVPEVGHAAYVFAKPNEADRFVRVYATTTKDDIRKNRDGIAERLRLLNRVMHGANPRTWLRELKERIGEPAEHTDDVT
jgi:hypothetical protein